MAKLLLRPGEALPLGTRKHLMRSHAEAFAGFDQASKEWYAQKASQMNLERRGAILEHLRGLDEAVDLLEIRGVAEEAARSTWCASACALSATERLELEAVLRSPQLTRSRVAKLRAEARRTPVPPDVLVQMAIRSHFIPRVEHPELPRWIREVAAKREHFVLCAFGVRPAAAAEEQFYELMYA